MTPEKKSRIFQSDLDTFLQTVSQKRVKLFIREASGTHYSSIYVILSIQEEPVESSWVYEAFSNFSSDNNGRKKSMQLAIEDLTEVRLKLQKIGFAVTEGEGLNCNNWSPCEVRKTANYFVQNVAVLQKE